jgi:hypothetical protein
MSIPSTIDVAFTQQYGTMIYILAQQMKSRFASRVRNETVSGAKDAYYERLGEAEIEDIVTRHPATPLNELPHTRRRVTMTDSHTNALLDHQDKLKMLINPENEYAQMQAAALGRKIDDKIITAAFGNAAAGVDGTTSVTFQDESVSINGDGTVTTLGTLAAVATIVDITLEKMLTMSRIYNQEDVDPDIQKYWAVSPKDIADMLDLTEVGSADYNTVKTLVNGKVDTYMGFNWFWTNRLTADAVTETGQRTLSWATDGLLFATAENIFVRMDERRDISYAFQVYSRMSNGAVRMEGAKVHECLNKIAV